MTSESTWVAVLISAAVGSPPGAVHVSLAWPALGLPAMAAIGWVLLVRNLHWTNWWKTPLVVAGSALGICITAGTVAVVLGPVPWSVAALHPWAVSDHRAAVAASVAWTVAILAWGRGIWLGLQPPSFRQATWSAGLGAIAFLSVFAGRLDHHAPGFAAETKNVGWSLLLFFPSAASALALIRERDLEAEVLDRNASLPGLAWVAVLALPSLVVVLAVLAAGFLVGAGAHAVIRAIENVLRDVWGGIEAAARWLWSLRPGSGHLAKPQPLPPLKVPNAPSGTHPGHVGHPSFTVPPLVWEALLLVLAVVVARYAWRHLKPVTRFRVHHDAETSVEEERSSVFSWRHLLDQLASQLARLRGALRRRDRRSHPGIEESVVGCAVHPEPPLPVVRDVYRSVLSTARTANHGRRASETPEEFAARLAWELPPVMDAHLRDLTAAYESIRYGDVVADTTMEVAAVASGAAVTASLQSLAEMQGPEAELDAS